MSGHCSVVRAGSDFWLVYHAWHYKQIGQNPPGRMMLIDKIRWDGDEWPVVGYPSDTGMSAPSGVHPGRVWVGGAALMAPRRIARRPVPEA